MKNKKPVVIIAAACLAAVCAFCAIKLSTKDVSELQNKPTEQVSKELKNTDKTEITQESSPAAEPSKDVKTSVMHASVQKEDSLIKHADLYNNAAGDMLPLSAINILSELPSDIKSKVLKLSESNNIYMMQKNKDKLFIITDNPSNIRHCIEFTEISLKNGHQVTTTLGYNDKIKDSDNDIWEYDDSKRPIRHSKYKPDGELEFVEVWNYDNNPVKYEMKDAEGHVISLRKETLDNDVNLRVEHLVYDKDGNTKVNVSTTYEGEDVKRFTYYNADKPNESGSVFTDYENGLKTKESVYTSDLKLKNSYTSEYKDGEREDITVWDNKNKEIQKLLPEGVDGI